MVQQPKIEAEKFANMRSQIKFVLYDLAGQAKAYYCVDILPILIHQAVIPLEPQYCYQVLVINGVEKICGGRDELEIPTWVVDVAKSQGSLTGIVYKYRALGVDEYLSLAAVNQQNHQAVYAFAKAQLEDGNFNLAKYALKSSFNQTLCDRHLSALSHRELLTFSYDLEQLLFHPEQQLQHHICNRVARIASPNSISLTQVMEYLSDHRQYILLNLKHIQQDYEPTGIKRVCGDGEESQQPWLKTEYIDFIGTNPYVRMGKVTYNRHSATMNLLIKRRVKLVKAEDDTPLQEIAGVFLDNLNQLNSYTIVRDGKLNLKSICIKIGNKAVYEWLHYYNLIADCDEFNFEREYTISLSRLPLVQFERKYFLPNGLFEQIIGAKLLMSMLRACLKNESANLIETQRKELKNHYLSANLYINFPYQVDSKKRISALVQGCVTMRQRYRIELGNSIILNLGKLPSANQFFQRRYHIYDDKTGEIFVNANLGMLWQKNLKIERKAPSRRQKNTPIYQLMESIFDEFIGLAPVSTIQQLLDSMGMASFAYILPIQGNREDRDKTEMVAALTAAYTTLAEYIDKTYREWISPLIFYIGTTGVLPDSFCELMGQNAMNAEEITIKYPNLKVSGNENDGLFFEVGNYILSIYPTTEYYSRQ